MKTDFQARDDVLGFQYMDGTELCQGYQSDLEYFHPQDIWVRVILPAGYTPQTFSRFSKRTVGKSFSCSMNVSLIPNGNKIISYNFYHR